MSNLIKEVKDRYDLSYSELAQITGAKEGTLRKSASTGEIGDIIRKSLEWYVSSKEKEEELEKLEGVKSFFRDFLGLK